MFEKVNPSHPDKIADRIAGALVDMAYEKEENPRIAVEVLIGHGHATIIAESSVHFSLSDVGEVVQRISGEDCLLSYIEVPQDKHLADNQSHGLRCGDNGIFRGEPMNAQECELCALVHEWYKLYPTDGKFILEDRKLIACQSCVPEDAEVFPSGDHELILNPLGNWTGGVNVDSGATNRKLGSDMGRAVTGGGLHGKDLSKADVSVNIVCHLLAQAHVQTVVACCAIGDSEVEFRIADDVYPWDRMKNRMPYGEVVEKAQQYIKLNGGFEKFAEWGLLK